MVFVGNVSIIWQVLREYVIVSRAFREYTTTHLYYFIKIIVFTVCVCACIRPIYFMLNERMNECLRNYYEFSQLLHANGLNFAVKRTITNHKHIPCNVFVVFVVVDVILSSLSHCRSQWFVYVTAIFSLSKIMMYTLKKIRL